ncbi:hypothetical protein ABFA07_012927 [Porites harrisoni]
MKICCASLICLLLVEAVVSSSAVLFKLEEKRDVTGHARKVDDIHTGSKLPHHKLREKQNKNKEKKKTWKTFILTR